MIDNIFILILYFSSIWTLSSNIVAKLAKSLGLDSEYIPLEYVPPFILPLIKKAGYSMFPPPVPISISVYA